MSVFDPNTFIHNEVKGEMDTVQVPIPEGEYPAFIDEVTAQAIDTKNGQQMALNVLFTITDDEVKEELGRDVVIARQTVWLDLDDNGALDLGKGKNVGLGKLRAAVGQNTAKAWAPGMLQGAGPVKVMITHTYNSEKDETYANVSKVTAG